MPTEFGCKVMLDEVDGGVDTRYVILAGNPPDAPTLLGSLEHHRAAFACAPAVLAADRPFQPAPIVESPRKMTHCRSEK
jgi:hypothetical protein